MAGNFFHRQFRVAANLFAWAAEQGFIGIAVYVACWVFMAPVMIGICIAGAALGWLVDKENEKQARRDAAINQANRPSSEAERRQWEEEDRRYEEQQRRYWS